MKVSKTEIIYNINFLKDTLKYEAEKLSKKEKEEIYSQIFDLECLIEN
jgi:hypothetical protein